LLHAARLVLASLRPAQVDPAETTILADRYASSVLDEELSAAASSPMELQLLLPHRGLGSLCLALDLLEGHPPALGLAEAAFVHEADMVHFSFLSARVHGPADARALEDWLLAAMPPLLEQPLRVRTIVGRDGAWRRARCLLEDSDGSSRVLVEEALPRWPWSRVDDADTIHETTSFMSVEPVRFPAPPHARRWLSID
jgi:hypothetical protein